MPSRFHIRAKDIALTSLASMRLTDVTAAMLEGIRFGPPPRKSAPDLSTWPALALVVGIRASVAPTAGPRSWDIGVSPTIPWQTAGLSREKTLVVLDRRRVFNRSTRQERSSIGRLGGENRCLRKFDSSCDNDERARCLARVVSSPREVASGHASRSPPTSLAMPVEPRGLLIGLRLIQSVSTPITQCSLNVPPV